jgi:hypothetical protein
MADVAGDVPDLYQEGRRGFFHTLLRGNGARPIKTFGA